MVSRLMAEVRVAEWPVEYADVRFLRRCACARMHGERGTAAVREREEEEELAQMSELAWTR